MLPRLQHDPEIRVRYFGVPRFGWSMLGTFLLLSLLLHSLSFWRLGSLPHPALSNLNSQSNVKVRIVEKPKADHVLDQKILEVRQVPTAAPVQPRFKGAQDHKTDKETKVLVDQNRLRAADPGIAGEKGKGQSPVNRAASSPQQQSPSTQKVRPVLAIDSVVSVPTMRNKPRNAYENLIPSANEMAGQIAAGYQDYIDDKVAIGDRVDINTADFRYIGYFTSMRKSIELVWNYPYMAVRRGLQGQVDLEFTILKDGTVKNIRVLQSSGFEILDKAIVDAIRLASPFSPLPDGFGKNKLTVTGSFRYVLGNG